MIYLFSFQVLKFGPLWATSAFCFESFNGDFVRRISSAKGPIQQIARRFVLQRYVRSQIAELQKRKPAVSNLIRLLDPEQRVSNAELGENTYTRLEYYVEFSDRSVEDAIVRYFFHLPDGLRYAKTAFIAGSKFQSLL